MTFLSGVLYVLLAILSLYIGWQLLKWIIGNLGKLLMIAGILALILLGVGMLDSSTNGESPVTYILVGIICIVCTGFLIKLLKKF